MEYECGGIEAGEGATEVNRYRMRTHSNTIQIDLGDIGHLGGSSLSPFGVRSPNRGEVVENTDKRDPLSSRDRIEPSREYKPKLKK